MKRAQVTPIAERLGDVETRDRLLEAATRLFAADGFKKVTVREICQAARANVAAVNYHFGDKMGLYREVLGRAIETMRATTAIAQRDGAGQTPEQKLAVYIRVFMDRVVKHGRDSWIHRLMIHEMADPTPALQMVIDQVIRPRMAYLNTLIAELLDATVDDPRVTRCSLSVHAQFQFVLSNPVTRMIVPALGEGRDLDRLAQHITEFSLAGIRAMRKK